MVGKNILRSFILLILISYLLFWLVTFLPALLGFDSADLSYLNTHLRYTPSLEASLFYLSGVAILIIGIMVGYLAFIRFFREKKRYHLLSKLSLPETWLWLGFFLCVVVGVIGFVKTGGTPLADISLRWQRDPKIIFVSFWQFIFLSGILVARVRNKKKIWPVLIIFILSLVFITFLGGARHFPLRAGLTLVATTIFLGKKIFQRILILFLLIAIATYLSVGVISKTKIVGEETSNYGDTAIKLLTNDAAISFWYLDQILEKSKNKPSTQGKILEESLLSMVPGTEANYGNTYIYNYLYDIKGPQQRKIGDSTISTRVSLATTFIALPYIDFGYGVFPLIFLIGLIVGLILAVAVLDWRIIPIASLLASELIAGVYGGYYSPFFLLSLATSIILIVTVLLTAESWSRKRLS